MKLCDPSINRKLDSEIFHDDTIEKTKRMTVLYDRYNSVALTSAATLADNCELTIDDAYDAVQQAWLQIMNDKVIIHSDFKSYFMRTVHNILISWARNRKQKGPNARFYPITREDGSTFDIADYRTSTIREDTFEDFMQLLPDRFHSVMTLRFVEDLTMQEIADKVGVKAGTVKSRIFDAKQILRHALADTIGNQPSEPPQDDQLRAEQRGHRNRVGAILETLPSQLEKKPVSLRHVARPR